MLVCNLVYLRKVKKIYRTQYHNQFTFKGKEFSEHVDKEFENFGTLMDVYFEDRKRCITSMLPRVEKARLHCIGDDFVKFNKGFDLLLYKIQLVFFNMLDLAFNENCMDKKENYRVCVVLLQDIKILMLNKYSILETINKNTAKYFDEHFTQVEYDALVELLSSLFKDYKKFQEELPDKRIVYQGELWGYFNEEKQKLIDKGLVEGQDEHDHLLDQPGGKEQYIAAKVMKHFKNQYGFMKEDYQDFIERKKLRNPYPNEDEEVPDTKNKEAEGEGEADENDNEGEGETEEAGETEETEDRTTRLKKIKEKLLSEMNIDVNKYKKQILDKLGDKKKKARILRSGKEKN